MTWDGVMSYQELNAVLERENQRFRQALTCVLYESVDALTRLGADDDSLLEALGAIQRTARAVLELKV